MMGATEEIKKTNHPDRIWATVNGMSTRLPDGARQLVGGWSQDAARAGSAEYVLAATLESLLRENEMLRRFLFPYADRTDISGISWDGKYLIGDKESIRAFHEMKNRGEQIDVYKRAYDQKEAALKARAEAAEAEVKRLTAKLAGCDWYWPEDDTSSDACANSQWEIAEIYDLKPADILAYSRGGIVETRYYAFLPPADDSDSDDNFEVDEPTEEEVAAKITAEIERRTALASTGGEHNGN